MKKSKQKWRSKNYRRKARKVDRKKFKSANCLVKITSDPKVYAVGKNGTLRHITSSAIAIQLYGLNWDDVLRDIPDFLFVNYKIGSPINKASDFVVSSVKDSAKSINEDKGL